MTETRTLAARDAELQALRAELRERLADMDAPINPRPSRPADYDAILLRRCSRVLGVARRIAEMP